MAKDEKVLEQYRRTFTPEQYTAIRELYKAHSTAEDARDIGGLLATLTPGCVYELVQTGHRWKGHEGAARFYAELLGAFPDVVFDLQHIVIGPQGVYEEAVVTGTWHQDWLGQPATGEAMEWRVSILFPYDVDAGLFTGERVWVDDVGRFVRTM